MTYYKQILLAASLSLLSGVASATPSTPIYGDISIGGIGNLDAALSSGTPGATTIQMNPAGGVNIDPDLLTGDFADFLTAGQTSGVSFATNVIRFEPGHDENNPIANFWQAGGFSFALIGLWQVSETGDFGGLINLAGHGIISGNGFEDTTAIISFTGAGLETQVGISTTTSAPEPALALLLSTGLVGFGVARKLRKKT